MGDVAQILGVSGQATSSSTPNKAPQAGAPAQQQPSRAMKITGVPRKVMDVLAGGNQDAISAALPPVVPAFSGPLKGADLGGGNKATGTSAVFEDQKGAGDTIATPAAVVKVGNRRVSTKKVARKWVWAPFASSARTDGLLLRHWVRAEVEYPDYPYARFDIHLDPVAYTDEEYKRYLQHETWTKSETDKLMELVRRFELRWTVIYDQWLDCYFNTEAGGPSPAAAVNRAIEDLQHRYYSVAATLTQTRISQEAAAETQALASAAFASAQSTAPANPSSPEDQQAGTSAAAENKMLDTAAARYLASSELQHQPLVHSLGTGTSNKVFDLNYERERRAHMELLWNRTKEDELEETELRKELRLVEAQLRKLKKTGGHFLAANGTAPAATSSSIISSSTALSRSSGPSPSLVSSMTATQTSGAGESQAPALVLDQCFASTAPTPMPENPYLQSGRLVPPATGGSMGLNKTLLARMDAVLAELKVPPRPIPTKRVCDLYDAVRKDILALLTLQKMVLQKEGQVQSKRLRLSKMGGNVRVLDEEALLGISNPSSTGMPSSNAAAAGRAKGPRGGKAKTTPVASTAKTKVSVAKAKVDENPVGKVDAKEATGKPKETVKKPTKRKRKTEPKSQSPTPAGGGGAATAVAIHCAPGDTTGRIASPVPPTAPPASEGGKGAGKKRARKNAPT